MAGYVYKPAVHSKQPANKMVKADSQYLHTGVGERSGVATAFAENGDGGARQTRRARLPAKGSGP